MDSKSKKEPTEAQYLAHKQESSHKRANPLRDVILGGQDGLVNALGIILGILAAGGSEHILVATVLAATFAESISMGAVAYTSALAQKDYYESEREKEIKEMKEEPEMEREEIRRIYAAKGFNGKVLDEIVDTVTADPDTWLNLMMAEELNLSPVNTHDVLKSSVIVTIATMIGHLIPLSPFFFVVGNTGLVTSVIISAAVLFAVGAYQAISLTGNWVKSGLRMLLIGIGAAFVGFAIAKIFHAAG